jgi:aldehyde:ferredoxin oxidoreductase
MMNSYSACLFSAFAVSVDDYARALSALFEQTVTVPELLAAGMRTWNLTRYFNCREGYSRQDDTLPARLFEDPVPDGPAKGQTIDRSRLEGMKNDYYRLMGWDESGRPLIDPEEYRL